MLATKALCEPFVDCVRTGASATVACGASDTGAPRRAHSWGEDYSRGVYPLSSPTGGSGSASAR